MSVHAVLQHIYIYERNYHAVHGRKCSCTFGSCDGGHRAHYEFVSSTRMGQPKFSLRQRKLQAESILRHSDDARAQAQQGQCGNADSAA